MAQQKSKSGTLVAHIDTRRVSEALVRQAPRPEFTETWHPFSHAEIIDSVGQACDDLKLKVIEKNYSMNSEHSKMFAVWEIERGTEELNFAVGFKNSTNKTHSVGLVAGEKVFICDNLIFQGDFVLFRKHTGCLELDEIVFLAREALGVVVSRFGELNEWHKALRQKPLSAQEASLLTVAAMRKALVPPARFEEFWRNFESDRYDASLHGWHGAVTELYKNMTFQAVMEKNRKLGKFIDYEVPMLIKAANSAFIDFKKVEIKAQDEFLNAREEKRTEARERNAEVKGRFKETKKEEKKEPKKAKKKTSKMTRPKPLQAKEKTSDNAQVSEKPKRRTQRRKIQEALSKESNVKGTTAKKVKGETQKTGQAAKNVQKKLKQSWEDDITPLAEPEEIG